jgi:hypothetical protein
MTDPVIPSEARLWAGEAEESGPGRPGSAFAGPPASGARFLDFGRRGAASARNDLLFDHPVLTMPQRCSEHSCALPTILVRALGLSALLLIAAASHLAAATPAERVLDEMIGVVDDLERRVPHITTIAEDAAERLVRGGQIYLAGDPGLVAELYGRAGGLCGARRLNVKEPLPALGENDVVLFSDAGGPGRLPTVEAWTALGKIPALLVAFAAETHPFLNDLRPANASAIPVAIGTDSRVARLPSGGRVIPLAGPAIATAQWAFVAELIGACRRRGKQLAIYLSIHLDEGRRRYRRTKGLLFEPDMEPEPVEKGQFARAFLGHVRGALTAVRKEELPRIRTAGAWIRTAREEDRRVLRQLHGHLPPHEARREGDPPCFTDTVRPPLGEKGARWMREHLRKGEVYLLVGYQQNEDAMSAAANALGARTIFLTSLPPAAQRAADPLHLTVNPHWPLTDGCLALPGYDVKACPLSAILGLSVYSAIAAEAVVGP